ncbi:heme peroxidase [Xylariaceae sp. FL0255]|nr:heme peroxidase [Xylariaceae sp. FL0255]
MRWNLPALSSAALTLSTLAKSDPTWPSSVDELEEIMYQVSGFQSRGFGGTVIPCSSEAAGPGRQNAAEWLRSAFHDMATTTISSGPRLGGLDGSLQYELLSTDNLGPGFNTTLQFMANYYTSRSGVADLIAMGVYYSVRSCGGPVVPLKVGRVDATSAGPIGVPLPENSGYTFSQQFLRMGFSVQEMIQVTACGHSIGGVHSTEFPDIVTAGTGVNGEVSFDETDAVFDNKVVIDYVAGNTTNPLVVGPSVEATRNSDFKTFSYDQNVTIKTLTNTQTFTSTCATVLQKLIEVVPDGVILTDPVQPYEAKPVSLQLQLNSGGTTMLLTGYIRVRSTNFGTDSAKTLTVTYKDRSGGNNCGSGSCTFTASVLGATQGFDDTFVWFPLNSNIPVSSGISSFTFVVTMSSGTTTSYDNNGNEYPMQDGIFLQTPQSCVYQGNMTVTAAVRNDLITLPANLYISYKLPTGDPNLPVPSLHNATVAMTKGDCMGSYTFYMAEFSGLGSLAYAAKIDVISGSGASALTDDFNAASNLGGSCMAFQNPPPASACVGGSSSSAPTSTSTSVSTGPTSVSVSTTTSPPTTTTTTPTSTTPAPTPSLRETVGGYALLGCWIESDVAGTRALSGASFAYDGMTLESCSNNCTSYYYWGTEYGRECYCGDSIASSSTNTTIDECSMTCSGDPTEYCGAGNRIEMYATTASIPPTVTPTNTPSVGSYEFQGCWTEGDGVRALSTANTAADDMTLETCATFCQDYHYFGVEYSRECYCGNVPDPSSNETAVSDCSMTCSGDASEFCGGSNRLDIFYSNTTNGPSQPLMVGNYSWFGCQTETSPVRILSAASFANSTMTLELCANFCDGYTYFGAEYSDECYCGDEIGDGSEVTSASACNMACAGDNKELCGGSSRLSIYELVTTPA